MTHRADRDDPTANVPLGDDLRRGIGEKIRDDAALQSSRRKRCETGSGLPEPTPLRSAGTPLIAAPAFLCDEIWQRNAMCYDALIYYVASLEGPGAIPSIADRKGPQRNV